MAWNPNVPTVTNRVQDDLDAIRENFQHLDQLAERVDELQTVSVLAQAVDELQAVSGLAPVANELQAVSGLAPVAGELEAVSELAPIANDLQTVSGLAPYVQALLDSRIVEMDSNSNGTYVRWENGLQVCFAGLTTSASQDTLWTLPAAFIDSGWVFSGGVEATFDSGTRVITFEGRTTNSITLRVLGAFDYPVSGSAFIIAIGRWK